MPQNCFALQQHIAPTAGVMVWSAIAYDTRSPLILIHRTMTVQLYVHDIFRTHVFLLRAWPPHYHSSLACSISNQAFLGSFGMANCTDYEFDRTRGAFTATVERDVSGHHTKLVCFNARKYRIMHSR
ncbi:transposable element Tcb1 transposase [Trichonephila clavipes]|nr:transposable element Tcb1 transposase [Trichonephila clavipes]